MYRRMPKKVDKSIQTDLPQKTSKTLKNMMLVQKTFKSGRAEKSENSDDEKKKALKEVGLFVLKTVGISAAVLGGVAIAVPVLGFTAGGVAAGSLAAAYQSAFLGGTIASGSAFATLQSIGAAGLALSTKAGIVAASAAVSGAHTAAKNLIKGKKKENKNNSKETETDESDAYQTDVTNRSSKKDVSTQTEFDT